MIKLLIATPSNRDWKAQFGISMCCLISDLTTKKMNFSMAFHLQTSLLPQARQNIVDSAITERFTHLLMIDDDMQFHPDAVHLMLKRDKDFVCANTVRKSEPVDVIVENSTGEKIISKGKTGIEEVFQASLGFCLVNVAVLENIPRPHFNVEYLASRNAYIGEDVYFFGLLQAQGKKLWVDHDASQFIGHIGDKVYKE